MKINELKLLDNPRNFSNVEYGKVLDFLLDLKNLLDKIQKAHNGELDYELSEEELATFSKEEVAVLQYCDDIDSIHWGTYNTITKDISTDVYFPNSGVCTLFINTLESIKISLAQIQNQYNCALDVNFDTVYKSTMKTDFDNLNYCIMDSFDLFSVLNGYVMPSVKEYCVMNNVDLFSLVEDMYNHYKSNRPTLPLFEKYPELAVMIEERVEANLFQDLVQYSNFLSKDEIQLIASGKLVVTEEMCKGLEDRFRDAMYGGEM